jgi:hypothetical protein
MRDDMCIPDGLLFMWGVVPNFCFAVSVVASQKPDFGTPKMENALFMGKMKIDLRSVPRHPKGHTRV